MKKIFFACLLFLAATGVEAQTYEVKKDRNGANLYTGIVPESIVKADTSYKWYAEAQNAFTPKKDVVDILKANRDSVHLAIFMGTWCPDSHFVIPRFFETLDSAGFKNVTLIGVDRAKKDGAGLAEMLAVDRVPTIIAYKNGRELGRVVEYGSTGKYDREIADVIKKAE